MRTAQELKNLIAKAGMEDLTAALADTPSPNARIIPDIGVLIITKGLVELLDDDEMLAVLLHEKSHLDRVELRADGICNGFELPDIARLRERVADADAVKGLEERGIGKEAMVRALNKVAEALGLNLAEEAMDHPSMKERIEAIA